MVEKRDGLLPANVYVLCFVVAPKWEWLNQGRRLMHTSPQFDQVDLGVDLGDGPGIRLHRLLDLRPLLLQPSRELVQLGDLRQVFNKHRVDCTRT
jgi:hypothetical protein